MKHLCILQKWLHLRTVYGSVVNGLTGLAFVFAGAAAEAQVATVVPTTFSVSTVTGGAFSAIASPAPALAGAPATGTGDRNAVATLCSTLRAGSFPGVSLDSPCAGAAFGTVNVGAAPNSSTPQIFGTTFTPAQLASAVTVLAAAGQPQGSRRFFVITQFVGSPVPPRSATRFVTLQVNLIEPLAPTPTPTPTPGTGTGPNPGTGPGSGPGPGTGPGTGPGAGPVPNRPQPVGGIVSATASLIDVAPNAPTPISIRYTLTGTDIPLAGQFCSAVNGIYPGSGVTVGNPCAPASNLGMANPAIGFTTALQTGEALVVPETIARQAAQRALASGDGIFYFVRQFTSGRYAVVRLRLNATSPNSPLAFNEIRLAFRDGGGQQNIGFFKRGQLLPAVTASLRYHGAGVLRARWEIVLPGDTAPTELDLRAEAELSPLERAQQRRYRVLERVNIYLPATGQAVLSGPPPRLLPNEQYGQYLLLLRLETSDNIAGRVAPNTPFVLPVLRYYIGESSGPVARGRSLPEAISLVAPQSGVRLDTEPALTFQWLENQNVSLYRLEIEANGKQAYAARVRPSVQDGVNRYTAPPFVAATLINKAARWRVIALASDGQFLGESEWRDIETAAPAR